MPCNFGIAGLGGVASAAAAVTLVEESVGAGPGAIAGFPAATALLVVETGWAGTPGGGAGAEFGAGATEGKALCMIGSSGCFTVATGRTVSRFCKAITTTPPRSARTTTAATISRMGGPDLRCWDGSAGLKDSAGDGGGFSFCACLARLRASLIRLMRECL